MPRLTMKQLNLFKRSEQKQLMLLKKQQQAWQKAQVAHDEAQGLTQQEVMQNKEQRQAEFRAQKAEMIRNMEQAKIDAWRETPEQMELDRLAMEANRRQEYPE